MNQVDVLPAHDKHDVDVEIIKIKNQRRPSVRNIFPHYVLVKGKSHLAPAKILGLWPDEREWMVEKCLGDLTEEDDEALVVNRTPIALIPLLGHFGYRVLEQNGKKEYTLWTLVRDY